MMNSFIIRIFDAIKLHEVGVIYSINGRHHQFIRYIILRTYFFILIYLIVVVIVFVVVVTVFIVCSASFIVCVVLCAVFCLSVVCYSV
jgi:hypothetical protein